MNMSLTRRIICLIAALAVATTVASADDLASLCGQLRGEDTATRVRAAQALGRLADPKAVGPLMTCAGGAKPTGDVFKACAAAMIQLGEKKPTGPTAAARKALSKKSPGLEFIEIDLADVIEFFRDVSKTNILVDRHALAKVFGKNLPPITVAVKGPTVAEGLCAALLSMGKPGQVGFLIEKGVVIVSSVAALGKPRPTELTLPGAKGVGFGMPKIEIIGEKTVDGRKVVRHEHGVVEQWGYTKPQRDYFNLVHPKTKIAPGTAPLHVVLHSAGHSGDSAMAGGFKHREWIHYHGRPQFYVLYLDCRRNRRTDWWWGYNAIKKEPAEYRDRLCPTEKRVLSTIEWVIKTHDIDRNRVYLSGISMGGSGSLGIGMCRGDVFAAVSVAVPAGIGHVMHRMEHGGEAGRPDPPVIVNYSSHIDNWAAGQEKLLAYCRKQRYPMVFAWGLFGHTNNINAANPAAYEFPWLRIRKNEAYPVFANASVDNRYPGHKNRTAPDQKNGQINAYFRWRNVSDTAKSFVMELRLVKKDELSRPIDTPREAVADVTLRRLQKFVVLKGKTYQWRVMRGGKVTQSGRAQPDAAGLLTIPKLRITDVPMNLAIGPDRAPR